MIEELQAALRALPITRLDEFKAFCARHWRRGSQPSAEMWHALAGVVAEAIDDVQDEVEKLERDFDDEGGIGEQLPGV